MLRGPKIETTAVFLIGVFIGFIPFYVDKLHKLEFTPTPLVENTGIHSLDERDVKNTEIQTVERAEVVNEKTVDTDFATQRDQQW